MLQTNLIVILYLRKFNCIMWRNCGFYRKILRGQGNAAKYREKLRDPWTLCGSDQFPRRKTGKPKRFGEFSWTNSLLGVDFQEIFDIIGAEESLSAGETADAVGISHVSRPA